MSDSVNLDVVRRLTAAIFECDPAELTAETRLMLDLPCESIDLLELSTGLARACGVNMNDNAAFLRSLEFHFARLQREGHTEAAEIAALCGPEFPHLAGTVDRPGGRLAGRRERSATFAGRRRRLP